MGGGKVLRHQIFDPRLRGDEQVNPKEVICALEGLKEGLKTMQLGVFQGSKKIKALL